MTKDDKKEMIAIFNQGVEEVILPVLEKFKTELLDKLASKEDLRSTEQRLREEMATKEQFYDVVVKLDAVDEKLDKLSRRQDYQEEETQDIKKAIAFS